MGSGIGNYGGSSGPGKKDLGSDLTFDHFKTGVIHKKVGPDFSGKTFRILKEKEEKQSGEYRTRRLVLEAWDAIERKDL